MLLAEKLYKCTVLIIVVATEISFSQLNPNNLVQFGEKDGLPEVEVGEILQDHLGYIWVPSINGLARFDGYEFKRYLSNPNDSTAIKGSIINSLFEDSKNNIWVGSNGFIEVYNPYKKSFKHYDYNHQVENPNHVLIKVHGIIEGSEGRFYFGIGEHRNVGSENSPLGITNGLLYYDEQDDRIKRYQSPDSLTINSVYGLISDSKGNIWFLGRGAIFKIDKKNNLTKIYTFDEKIINKSGRFHDLKSDKEGVLWITGTNSKFFSFDPITEKMNSYSLNGLFEGYDNKLTTFTIAVDKLGNIWLGSERGLIFYDRKSKKYKTFNSETKRHIERTSILGLNFDSFGSLWIGTVSSGLLKYDERISFESYSFNKDDETSLTSGWANRIIEGKSDKIWISTGGSASQYSGINEFDPGTKSIKKFYFKNFLPGIYGLFGIYQASGHEFYLSTVSGLYLFTSNNSSIEKINLYGLPENTNINDFYNDSRGNLWLCTNKGIYKQGKNDDNFIHYDLEGSSYITRVFESKYHGLWLISTSGLWLYDYNSDKIKRHGYDTKEGDVFLSQNINSIYEDNDGIVWVGTWQGGLSRYNRETRKIKTFTIDEGLPSMSIQGILGDEENNTLWLSTFDGLVRFNKNSEKFSNFSVADGIQSQLFADGSYLKTSGGLFIFGGSNGITVFDPKDIVKNLSPPKVFLTDLKLSDKSVLPGNGSILEKPLYETDIITLEHDNNNLSLEFVALHYLNSSKNQYAYMLENYENDWRYVGNQRIAYYPNLPPGEYIFRVKASNNHDLWNEKGATLKIIITPPWWKTLWAYLSYSVFFILALYWIRRYEMNRISYKSQGKLDKAVLKEREETDRLKSRFFTNISHEFRTPLTLILGPSENIISEAPSENTIKQAGTIKRNANRLLGLINQLLDLSKLEAGKLELKASKSNIVPFIKGITMSFESAAESKDITLKVKSVNDEIEMYFDNEKMTKIMTNLLSNAFKFTPEGGRITVSVTSCHAELVSASPNEHEIPILIKSGRNDTFRQKQKKVVNIKVRDTGVGISKDELPKLFDRFYQVDSSQIREHEGTGIGLSLTKELVELHHGTISVDSKLGDPNVGGTGWTEFTIDLPLGRKHLSDAEIVEVNDLQSNVILIPQEREKNLSLEEQIIDKEYSSSQAPQNDNLTNKEITLILIVEDNADVREFIKDSLGDDFQIEEASNGEQGVRKAEKIIPDLIISDIMMPKMDGYELTRKLKNDEKTSHIPIILLTAKSEQESKLEGLKTGADDYLTKPFDTKELQIRIKNLINIRKELQKKYSKGEFLYKPSGEKIKSIDEKFLTKIIKVIEKHLCEEDFSIEECGSEVGMSRTHLYKKVKALVGKSPSQYVRTVRLTYAKKMIEEGKGNISEIAYSVGFSSPAYFSRCFKEEFGYPPSNILR